MTTTRGLEREITQRLHDWESAGLIAVGAVGLFSTVPRAMMRLVPGSTGAALGLLMAGCLLVAGAVLTLRRQR
jgi:hypothetical protein